MPDEETTEETTAETPEAEAPPSYVFPFPVPADLSTLDDEALRALHQQVREHGASFAAGSPAETAPDRLEALSACVTLARAISDEVIARQDAAAQAEQDAAAALDLANELGGLELPEPPAPEPAPAAVTASAARRAAPSARQVASRRPASAPTPVVPERPRASLVASMDFAGYQTGQTLERFSEVGTILSRRIDQYPAAPVQRGRQVSASKRPITVYDPDDPGRRLTMTNYQRHAGVQIRRAGPDDLRVTEDNTSRAWEIAMHAGSERRLPGGSLIEAFRASLKSGTGRRGLTAAAGWCAPSDTIYDLVELETLFGILDAPELETPRGGWQIPVDGGPNFSTIWSSIGNSGNTHLTEAEVIADTSKVCVEIPCPDFDEVRLGVDYVCITGSLLQRRGYPEAVARFTRAATIALAHKINAGFINDIVTGSSHKILGSDPSGDDAASAVLSAIELAVKDIQHRNRMGDSATVEVVIPSWVTGPIRAGLSRRNGVALFNVTDAMIVDWMTERGAVPRFVYDWQDSYNGTGLGGSTPASAYPSTVRFAAYPAGTWVKAVADVVDLDTIYDSTNLQANAYTAVFTETGWAALKMSPTSYVYTVPIDVSGVVACCPDLEVS